MPERLVDVETQGSQVLHTFPVTISAPAAEENAFKEKALAAAGNAKLVPNEELDSLNAKMSAAAGPIRRSARRARGDQGGSRPGCSRARLLALGAGGSAGWPRRDFWHQAQHERFCERAYALWEREGCPEGKADEHWFRTRAFEES